MNRRSFLQASSMAAIGTIATRGQSGSNPLLIANSQAAHIGAIANFSRGYMFASDWNNIVHTTTVMNANLQTSNLDSIAKQSFAKLIPSQITPALLATAKANVLQAVRVYNPACTAAQMNTFTNSMNYQMTPTGVINAINQVKALGITPYIGLWANHAVKIEQALMSYGGVIRGMRPPNDPGEGTGGYDCEDDSSALDLVGITIGVLAVLATPGFGEIALVAGAGAMLGWGSAGVVGWTIGHVAFCGV